MSTALLETECGGQFATHQTFAIFIVSHVLQVRQGSCTFLGQEMEDKEDEGEGEREAASAADVNASVSGRIACVCVRARAYDCMCMCVRSRAAGTVFLFGIRHGPLI